MIPLVGGEMREDGYALETVNINKLKSNVNKKRKSVLCRKRGRRKTCRAHKF